jgi:hypothetical protein
MPLPISFVWTKFGTEAGQTITEILERKERERIANDGLFFWGIGNAVGPSIMALLASMKSPEVLFSPMKSPARAQDVSPESVVAWTSAAGLDGKPYSLPVCSMITSRFSVGRLHHYALVCSSDSPLADPQKPSIRANERIAPAALCNFLTGRPLGASQVTSVVQQRAQPNSEGCLYPVSFRARLAPPYFVRLSAPRPVTGRVVESWAKELSFSGSAQVLA